MLWFFYEEKGELFVPSSLRKLEQKILDELDKSKLKVSFSITNYDLDTNKIDYYLISTGDSEVPNKAKKIVEQHLDQWKATFTR